MAELGWLAPVVMREDLQNLVSQGYMTAVELATYRVPTDLVSPAPATGYVVACSVFYKRRFGAPPH
jgi:hypothetical protein